MSCSRGGGGSHQQKYQLLSPNTDLLNMTSITSKSRTISTLAKVVMSQTSGVNTTYKTTNLNVRRGDTDKYVMDAGRDSCGAPPSLLKQGCLCLSQRCAA